MANHSKVEVYYWASCPFCVRALALLNAKEVSYSAYEITGDAAARAKMVIRTGGARSLPQIFIDDQLIGGCDDLYALESQGKLDMRLKGAN